SYVATRYSGGVTLGAVCAAKELLGKGDALPALAEKLRPYYYSHMLAVEPRLQNAGLGVRMKLAQRDPPRKKSGPPLTLTFDPLQSRNAYLNIVKLGGVVRRYCANFYGANSTSVFHRDMDTDRLFIEWWVRSPRDADALKGVRRADKPEAVVEVPRDIGAIKRRDLDEARRWQSQIREGFQKCLNEGLYCAGFETDPKTNSRYLFFRDHQQEKEEGYKK